MNTIIWIDSINPGTPRHWPFTFFPIVLRSSSPSPLSYDFIINHSHVWSHSQSPLDHCSLSPCTDPREMKQQGTIQAWFFLLIARFLKDTYVTTYVFIILYFKHFQPENVRDGGVLDWKAQNQFHMRNWSWYWGEGWRLFGDARRILHKVWLGWWS